MRDGELLLIDVAFVQVRPSPWRQAVDLANMMLVLAVRTDAERVYERALRFFTPDEIAEAFAATRGVASPTQLRTVMKQDGRDLVTQFRRWRPERRPISLQRWSPRRVVLAATLVVVGFLAMNQAYNMFVPAELQVTGTPTCGTSNLMVLMAQSVPEATSVPCVASVPAGWDVSSIHVKRERSTFTLDSDQAGTHAVVVTLVPADECSVDGASEVPSDEPDMRQFERPERVQPSLKSTRYYLFPGGCVTYQYDFDAGTTGLPHLRQRRRPGLPAPPGARRPRPRRDRPPPVRCRRPTVPRRGRCMKDRRWR